MELQQLFNEDEDPYVSARSRANPFLKHSGSSFGFGDGVDIEEIFDDGSSQPLKQKQSFLSQACSYVPTAQKALQMAQLGCKFYKGNGVDIEEIFDDQPSQPLRQKESFLSQACSYVPTAQKALQMAQLGCKFYKGSGSGCPMCCGGEYSEHLGGCANCPFCSGMGGGVGELVAIKNMPILMPSVVDEINDNYQSLMSFLNNRYGLGFRQRVSNEMRNKIYNDYKSLLTKSEKYQYLKRLDNAYNFPRKQVQEQYPVSIVSRPTQRTLSVAESLGIPADLLKIGQFVTSALSNPALQQVASSVIQNVIEGKTAQETAAKVLTDVLQEESKGEVKAILSLRPASKEQAKQKAIVEEIIKTVETLAPIQEIKKITTVQQAEQAKEEIKETYAQCLNRYEVGQKRKNCEHLTKAYLQRKLLQVELTKYKNYAECMADSTISKGMKRKTCHKYTKAFKMQHPDLFAEPVGEVSAQPVSNEPPQEPKYKSFFECMQDSTIPKGMKRKTCHPYARSAMVKQKASTIKRNNAIKQKAKQLKDKYPDMPYNERVKRARKLVK
jgi:hypothetical protein